jgi:methyl-accepting chemotaxis protein
MKHLAHVVLALTAFALSACSKPNDLHTLQTEAAALATYYGHHVALVQRRMEHLNQRSKQLANPTDREAAAAAFTEAASALREMNATVTTIQQQAEELAKAGKRADLERLVASAEDKLVEAKGRIDEELGTDDSWLAAQEHAPVIVPTQQTRDGSDATP